jgi:hypothetical protein
MLGYYCESETVTFSSVTGPNPSQIESFDPLFVSPTDPIRTELRVSTELFENLSGDDPANAPPEVCVSLPALADAGSQAGSRPQLSLREFTPPADQIF